MRRFVIIWLFKLFAKSATQNTEYRSILIQGIHQCARRFHEVAASAVELLMDFITDSNATSSAVDVISFVKETVERFPKLRSNIVERLLSTLGEVRAGKIFRGALWIVGAYALEEHDIREAWYSAVLAIAALYHSADWFQETNPCLSW